MKLSREFRIDPRTAGLLVVDVQKYVFELVKTAAKASRSSEPEVDEQSFLRHLNDTTIPNISGLVEESRAASIEIIYTVIESLTRGWPGPQSRLQNFRPTRAQRLGCGASHRICRAKGG